ncbi:MAG: TetR/AcrR family transcriptional regulator [Sneathiellaceae bacterium]
MRKALTDDEIAAFRDRLCAVAERLFARHGVAGVTMRQIARELDYSQTAAYRYFENKDEILAAVRASAFNRFADRLDAGRTGRGPRADARAMGRAYLRFAVDEPDAYRLIFDVQQPDTGLYPDLAAAAARARACMTGYVRALVEAGELDGDPDELGTIFWAGAHGLVMLHLAGLVPTLEGLQDLHVAMMRMLLRGGSGTDRG